MPQVRKQTIIAAGVEFQQIVYVRADGVFRIKLPREVQEELCVVEVTGHGY